MWNAWPTSTDQKAGGSLFDKYLNAKPAENDTSHVRVGYEHGSPLCQLMDDYREWKQDSWAAFEIAMLPHGFLYASSYMGVNDKIRHRQNNQLSVNIR